MVRPLLALLAAAALARTGAAQATRWDREVREQLRHLAATLAEQGYRPSHDVRLGELGPDETAAFTIELVGGRAYAVMGVCDEDCRNLDLRLLDREGAEVGRDAEPNAFPRIQIQPEKTGDYRVSVVMKRCLYSPCHYGIGIFTK